MGEPSSSCPVARPVMLFLLVLLSPAVLYGADMLRVGYFERPPFMQLAPSGRVEGLVATPVAAALADAGIPFRWQRIPAARQLADIQENRSAVCAPGWFRNPARERFARFSAPVYRDAPMIGLARADYPVSPDPEIGTLLAEARLRLIVKRAFSYGPVVDAKIATMAGTRIEIVGETAELFEMIRLHRADLAFVAAEEADHHLGAGGFAENDFRRIAFRDMPAGQARHLMCSLRVDPAVLQRFDAALARRQHSR